MRLVRFWGVKLPGPMAVWIGMFADWTARAVIFSWRYFSRRWLKHQVV